jgi:anthranilate phosphoribosyltransferase
MSFAHYIKEIGHGEHGHSISEEDAYQLFGAMLDGGVPDLELGAILAAMSARAEPLDGLLGFYRASAERLNLLYSPTTKLKPIVIPTYTGARHQANLVPLVALVLQRFGVPVLLHGTLESFGGASTAHILRELGIMPQPSLTAAQKVLDEEGLVFVPTAAISPGLANLMALRHRLGFRNSAHTIVKLIAPFVEESIRMVSMRNSAYLEMTRDFFSATNANALLMGGTDGEAFANPERRPQIEYFETGRSRVLFEAEGSSTKFLLAQPANIGAHETAAWIRDCLVGRAPIPYPIVNQLACCLYVSGYTEDMNQAKAIAAVETGSLAAA